MNNSELQKPSLKKLGVVGRKAIGVSQQRLIKVDRLLPDKSFPLLVRPAMDGVNLVTWARNNREFIEANLLKHGAILIRGFQVKEVSVFEQFIEAISEKLLDYSYRSTPRSQVSGKIYTSTEYPANQSIPLHNEMSYSNSWPKKIWFFCLKSATRGGETPIADSRNIFKRIDPKIREQLTQKKVLYVRNYNDGLDLTWQNVFQTTSKSDVEAYCRKNGMDFKWTNGNGLRTSQLCQAVAVHPGTKEMVWFNQAHLFHISNLEPEIRASLLSRFTEENLPRNAYYGDGSPIESSVLDHIRDIHQQEAVSFPWQEGDILMLDNMLMAHGRTPFIGPRKIVVGMAEPSDDVNVDSGELERRS